MPGWITYAPEKESVRRMPVIFIPALHSRWMLLAGDLREHQKPILEKKASLGFYCGLLSGQTAADYPPLAADLPEYCMGAYEPVYLLTPAALDLAVQVSVTDSGNTGVYSLRDLSPGVPVKVRVTLPASPAATVHECRYFGFSPYILKEK